MRISQAYSRYVKEYLIIKNVDMNQIIHYRSGSRLFVGIVGDLWLEEIDLEDIAKFTSGLKTYERNRSVNTIAGSIKQLRVVLRYWRLRGEDVMDSSIIPIPKREPNVPAYLTREEVSLMIRKSRSIRTKFVISLLYSSGVRVSELRSMNRDVIRDGMFTIIGKGKKPRICFIDKRTQDYMEKYLERRSDRSEALLVTAMGNRASVSTIQLIVRNASLRANINKKVTPHTLRHSFATNYISNNGNIRHLAVLMGHNSIDTTSHYAHIIDNDLRREYDRHHSC